MTDALAGRGLDLSAIEARIALPPGADQEWRFAATSALQLVAACRALREALTRLRIAQHRMDDAWLDGDNTARALAQLELQQADEAAVGVLAQTQDPGDQK